MTQNGLRKFFPVFHKKTKTKTKKKKTEPKEKTHFDYYGLRIQLIKRLNVQTFKYSNIETFKY